VADGEALAFAPALSFYRFGKLCFVAILSASARTAKSETTTFAVSKNFLEGV
jgi:hypothetical protein